MPVLQMALYLTCCTQRGPRTFVVFNPFSHWDNSHIINILILVVYSVLTVVRPSPLSCSRLSLSPFKKRPTPLAVTSHFPLPPASVIHESVFCLCGFAHSEHFTEMEYVWPFLCGFFHLAWCFQVSSLLTCISTFCGWIILNCMGILTTSERVVGVCWHLYLEKLFLKSQKSFEVTEIDINKYRKFRFLLEYSGVYQHSPFCVLTYR